MDVSGSLAVKVSSSGSSEWPQKVGPHHVGLQSTAVVDFQVTKPRYFEKKWRALVRDGRSVALVSICWVPRCCFTPPKSRKSSTFPTSSMEKSAGVRVTVNPMRVQILPVCEPRQRIWAITTRLMAQKCGPLTQTRPTGFFAWYEQTSIAQNTRGSASSCLTWPLKESARSPIN